MKTLVQYLLKAIGYLLIIPVYFYKYAISPLTSPSCRHEPTCSQYAIDAIKIHGPFKGFWLGTKRIANCHPWRTQGYDPIPSKNKKRKKQNYWGCPGWDTFFAEFDTQSQCSVSVIQEIELYLVENVYSRSESIK